MKSGEEVPAGQAARAPRSSSPAGFTEMPHHNALPKAAGGFQTQTSAAWTAAMNGAGARSPPQCHKVTWNCHSRSTAVKHCIPYTDHRTENLNMIFSFVMRQFSTTTVLK